MSSQWNAVDTKKAREARRRQQERERFWRAESLSAKGREKIQKPEEKKQ